MTDLTVYLASFVLIWFGAGLIISSVDTFSKKLKISSFAVSFVILGLLTSTPEFAVGLAAIEEGSAEIFIGNLLGGIPVIFLFIIPLLAIFGNGIRLRNSLDTKRLIITLGVILAPSFLILDRRVSTVEGAILIFLYVVLLFFIEGRNGFLDKKDTAVLNLKAYSYKELLKLLIGIGVVFMTSQFIVDKTLYFSEILKINPFYMSLIVLSLGTNLPELSLVIRSIFWHKKDIAFGDYVGSAAANTLLFGVFTILHNGEVLTIDNFIVPFLFIAGGLVMFFLFSRSKNGISRQEGVALFLYYVLFCLIELGT